MKCTDKQWQHCQVEKRGCEGCYYYENDEEVKKAIDQARSNILRGNDIDTITAMYNVSRIFDGLIIRGGRVNIFKVAVRQLLNSIETQQKELDKKDNIIKEKNRQIQNIREEFLKYDWKNSNSEQIYNQLKNLYKSIFEKKADDKE